MQMQGGQPAADVIEGVYREFRSDVQVAWGGRWDHPLTGLNVFDVKSVSVDRALAGVAPAELLLIEGAAAAKLTVVLGGVYQGMSAVEIFSPYNASSPLHEVDRVGAEILWKIAVIGSNGIQVLYPQFIGNIRTIEPDRASNSVTITALDWVEKLRKPVLMPAWAASAEHLNYGEVDSQLMHSHWVIDNALRWCNVSSGDRRWVYREEQGVPDDGQDGVMLFITGNGSYVPSIGYLDNPNACTFPSAGTPMFLADTTTPEGGTGTDSPSTGGTPGGGGTGGGSGSGTEAAVVHSWGPVAGGTENWSDLWDEDDWTVVDGVTNQWGTRRASQVTVADGVLRITGTQTGGVGGQVEWWGAPPENGGRYEVRMRVPQGDWTWKPVALLWPYSEDWPDDGEVDWVETAAGTSSGGGTAEVGFNLHYGAGDTQISDTTPPLNLRDWHNFAVEWVDGSHIKGYVDGQEYFSATTGLPPGPMFLSFQLDWMGDPSTVGSTVWEIDWLRYYDPEASGPPSGGGSNPLADPVLQEKCLQITSTAENSTVQWWTSYSYIEDILDGRGYTAGIVGFTSATGDMLALVQRYLQARPSGNPLASWLNGLIECAEYGDTVDDAEYGVDGGGASDMAAARLGSAYRTAWTNAANNDSIFRRVQREYRDDVYWRQAYDAAVADGVGPLGLALYYDTSVNHGPGEANSGDGSFTDIRSRTSGTKPINGGNQTTWLNNFLSVREDVLEDWGDNPDDGRVAMFEGLISSGNLTLTVPFSWSVYGDGFTMSTNPAPHTD